MWYRPLAQTNSDYVRWIMQVQIEFYVLRHGLANSHSNIFVPVIFERWMLHTFTNSPWLRGLRLIMLVLSMMNAVIRVGVCVCAAIIVWALLCKYYFRGQTNPHYQQGHRPQPKEIFKQEEVVSFPQLLCHCPQRNCDYLLGFLRSKIRKLTFL